MLKRRSHVAAGGGLPLHLVDFLLGVRRGVREIEQLTAAGIRYDSFFEFTEMPGEEWQRLWREHGAALRAEAKRRGIVLQPVPSGDGSTAA